MDKEEGKLIVFVATEDGSAGYKGTVVELLGEVLNYVPQEEK